MPAAKSVEVARTAPGTWLTDGHSLIQVVGSDEQDLVIVENAKDNHRQTMHPSELKTWLTPKEWKARETARQEQQRRAA